MDVPEPLAYHGKPFWSPDPFDRYLPRAGFVTDFVLALRGQEVPVAFSAWCSLVALSTALKRETWLRWSEDHLYPNLFLVLVSPAGAAKKSAPINLACTCLRGMEDYFSNVNVAIRKNISIFRDKITGEAIFKFLSKKMRPRYVSLLDEKGHPLCDSNGSPVKYRKSAEVLLVAPELGTMLSRAKYNEDLITTLTKLYDTESDIENTTSGGGIKRLPDPFTCLLGGTTPSAIRDSIPRSAVDEGFLSRLLLIYQSKAASLFHRPRSTDVPRNELASRLAWIAEHTAGQWDLASEADRFYEKWYIALHENYDLTRFHPAQKSRFAIHVLKVALLLSAQRYDNYLEKGRRVVSLVAVKEAIALVEATMESAVPLIQETEATPFQRLQLKTWSYLMDKKKASRKQLLQNLHLTAGEATAAISDLFQAGRVKVAGGGTPSYTGDEVYVGVKEKR